MWRGKAAVGCYVTACVRASVMTASERENEPLLDSTATATRNGATPRAYKAINAYVSYAFFYYFHRTFPMRKFFISLRVTGRWPRRGRTDTFDNVVEPVFRNFELMGTWSVAHFLKWLCNTASPNVLTFLWLNRVWNTTQLSVNFVSSRHAIITSMSNRWSTTSLLKNIFWSQLILQRSDLSRRYGLI